MITRWLTKNSKLKKKQKFINDKGDREDLYNCGYKKKDNQTNQILI